MSHDDDGFDRRAFLRRAAIGGVTAWGAGVIVTLDASPASASPVPCLAAGAAAPSSSASMTTTQDLCAQKSADCEACCARHYPKGGQALTDCLEGCGVCYQNCMASQSCTNECWV